MSKGVLYVASGDKYIREAERSIESLRNHMPEIPVTLYADRELSREQVDCVRELQNPDYHFGDSILTPQMIPYDRTLYLDTDTYITEPINELFDLLDRFEIAAAHNPARKKLETTQSYAAQGVPESFPQYNTGVLALKKNERISEFLLDWNRIYNENNDEGELNQPSFREALYKNDIHIATLTPEYNCRIPRAGYLHGSAKILHGHHPDVEKVEQRLNSNTCMRVFTTKRWPVQVISEESSLWWRLRFSLKDRGLKQTSIAAFRKILSKLE